MYGQAVIQDLGAWLGLVGLKTELPRPSFLREHCPSTHYRVGPSLLILLLYSRPRPIWTGLFIVLLLLALVVSARLVFSSLLFLEVLTDYFIFSSILKMLRRLDLYSTSESSRGKQVLELLWWHRYWRSWEVGAVTNPKNNRLASLSFRWTEYLEF